MLRKITGTLAFVLTFAFALGTPLAAQDSTPDSGASMEDYFEYGYARMYADPEAVDQGTPPAEGEVGAYFAGVIKLTDEDVIEDDFRGFTDGFAEGFFGSDVDVADATEIDDIGDEAYEYIGEQDGVPVTAIISHDDEFVVVAMAVNTDEPGSANDLAEYLLDADESDDPVEFNEDGTSTGGAFDMMPEAGDDVVDGFEPIQDLELVG